MKSLYIGRFQPFHKGHLSCIKQILSKFDGVVIIIGSSQESGTKNNPFSAGLREKMIKISLEEQGIDKKKYKIIKIPDVKECDESWVKSILKQADFDIVHTNNSWTKKCFEKKGFKTKPLKYKIGCSGNLVRGLIEKGKNWKILVPKSVIGLIEQGLNHLKML